MPKPQNPILTKVLFFPKIKFQSFAYICFNHVSIVNEILVVLKNLKLLGMEIYLHLAAVRVSQTSIIRVNILYKSKRVVLQIVLLLDGLVL